MRKDGKNGRNNHGAERKRKERIGKKGMCAEVRNMGGGTGRNIRRGRCSGMCTTTYIFFANCNCKSPSLIN